MEIKEKFRPIGKRILGQVQYETVQKQEIDVTTYNPEIIDRVINGESAREEMLPTDRILALRTANQVEEVKEGDMCVFNQYTGTPIKLKGSDEVLLLVTEENVYGIIEEA